MPRSKGPKFYAVAHGRQPGLHTTWEKAKRQVDKYPGARHKSFKNREDAQKWLNDQGVTVSNYSSWQKEGTTPLYFRADDERWTVPAETNHESEHHRDETKPTCAGKESESKVAVCMSSSASSSQRSSATGKGSAARSPAAMYTPDIIPSGSRKRERLLKDNVECYSSDLKRRITPKATREFDIVVQSDGGARGNPVLCNPGEGGAGAVCYLYPSSGDKTLLRSCQVYLGKSVTNNEAEYQGFLEALALCRETVDDLLADHNQQTGAKLNIAFELDSKLVVNQITGIWKINSESLRPLFQQARDSMNKLYENPALCKMKVRHVFRDFNTDADILANQAMDTKVDEKLIHQNLG